MAYDIGLRQALNGKGVDNNRIGFNVNTGTVTVDGRDFLRPQKNFNGTTFTDQGSFNQAWQNFGNNQAMPQPGQNVQIPTTGYQNPYDTKVSDTLAGLMNRINNPQQIDPYSTPEYAAAQAQQGRNTQQGIRTAQESLGASGFARSTNLADRAQNIQNSANEYLMTQVVPQIIAQKRAEEQQGLANLMSLLGAFSNQQGVYDTRDQRSFERGIQEGTLTGNYLNADAKSILHHVLEQKAIAEDPSTTEAGRIEAGKQADAYRALLPNYGIDPNIVGSGVNLATARQNVMGAGKSTLAQKQLNENTRQFDVQTEQNAKQFAEKMGFDWASLSQRDKEAMAQLAISQQNADTSAGQLGLEREKFQYDKDNPKLDAADKNGVLASVIADVDAMTPENRKKFFAEEKANIIAEIGLPGYNQLKGMYFDENGDPK